MTTRTAGRWTAAIVLGAIAVTALALRLVGLRFGLPAVYNPDEIAIVARALTFAKGTLIPVIFLYPSFFFYVLFAWLGVYFAFVWLTGGVSSLAELPKLYFANPTGIYTAGRALGAIAGTATVLLLYRLAARVTNTRAALAAATFLAVAPLHVRDSHYATTDNPKTFFVMAAMLATERFYRTRDARDAWLAGALAG